MKAFTVKEDFTEVDIKDVMLRDLATRFVYYILTVHIFKPYSRLTKFLSTNFLTQF